MSYYRFFDNYSVQTAFTSNTKFFNIANNIYNKKDEIKDESKEDNKEDQSKDKVQVPNNGQMQSCNCNSCSV